MSKITKITQKTVLDICQKEKQMNFYNTLINYLEFLTEERSADEKLRFAHSLIESYEAPEIDNQKDFLDEA